MTARIGPRVREAVLVVDRAAILQRASPVEYEDFGGARGTYDTGESVVRIDQALSAVEQRPKRLPLFTTGGYAHERDAAVGELRLDAVEFRCELATQWAGAAGERDDGRRRTGEAGEAVGRAVKIVQCDIECGRRRVGARPGRRDVARCDRCPDGGAQRRDGESYRACE
ncbi:MAG: hypothetical protein SGJ11_14100 [Phycisphaerae bacterium]|nr:hypothetical protein [Phycisphaerae bacterium]